MYNEWNYRRSTDQSTKGSYGWPAHYGVEVMDNNGVIVLRGIVPSREASTAIEMVAKEVDGVVSVINETDVIVNK